MKIQKKSNRTSSLLKIFKQNERVFYLNFVYIYYLNTLLLDFCTYAFEKKKYIVINVWMEW